jgi:hypothetical protein
MNSGEWSFVGGLERGAEFSMKSEKALGTFIAL